MAMKLGMNGQMTYSSASGGAGILSNVTDVTLTLESAEADVTTRANSGWRAQVGTLKEGTLEFEMIWDDQDAGFSAIKDAFLGNSAILLGAYDSPTADGGSGLLATYVISNLTRTEGLEEAMKANVTAQITIGGTAPVWIN